jgi:hypothetical protein
VNYYYVCTRQQHEGGKYSCQASRIPAEALENAIVGRIAAIGRMVEARDRIVQEALSCLGGEANRLREAEDLARRRLAQVHADIGRLVEVLKSLGARGLASVQSELERLEEEEGQIKNNLTDLAKRQAPVERVSDDARSFLETWQDIGELLEAATPEERLQLLQHYIEVVELGPIDPETRTGSYAMRLFPEVRPDRGFDFGGDNGPDDSTPGPETTNGAIHVNGNGSACVNRGQFGSHNCPESSPRRPQLDFGLRRSRHLTAQEVASSRSHRALSVERPFGRPTRTQTRSEGRPRSTLACTLLRVATRLRQIREPGSACSPPRRQSGQGNAGTCRSLDGWNSERG